MNLTIADAEYQVMIQLVNGSREEELVEPDDIATDLDAPEPPTTHEQELRESPSPAEQLADVSPQLDEPDEASEPRPGC